MNCEKKPRKSYGKYILYVLFGLLIALGAAMYSLCLWYKKTFDIEFKTLLYVLSSPLQGTGAETIKEVITVTVPAAVAAIAVYIACVFLINRLVSLKAPRVGKALKRIGAFLCALSVVLSSVYAVYVLRIPR